MDKFMKRHAVCPSFCLMLSLAMAPSVQAKVAATDLMKLASVADAIVIAKVHRVTTVGDVKMAVATVIRPLRGLPARQTFAFVAQGTWTCDTSEVVSGETVLLFLNAERPGSPVYSFLDARSSFSRQRTRQLGGMPVFGISWSGYGRMPVYSYAGKGYIEAFKGLGLSDSAPTLWTYGVELPRGLRSIPHPGQRDDDRRLVPLRAVEERLHRLLGRARPLPKPATIRTVS